MIVVRGAWERASKRAGRLSALTKTRAATILVTRVVGFQRATHYASRATNHVSPNPSSPCPVSPMVNHPFARNPSDPATRRPAHG